LSTAKVALGTSYSYPQSGYNEVPQWQRIDTAAAPDGHLIVAWQGADGIHVTPLDRSGQRTGADAVVPQAREVSGLVAFNDPADSSGRGWSVTSKWSTHQVAVSFLGNASTPSGSPMYLTTDTGDDHVDARIVPYGAHDFLVSWETVTNARCSAGTCTGTFAGTHVRVVDGDGRFLTPDLVVQTPFAGDPATLPDGSIAWAGPSRSASAGVGATTSGLIVAVLRP